MYVDFPIFFPAQKAPKIFILKATYIWLIATNFYFLCLPHKTGLVVTSLSGTPYTAISGARMPVAAPPFGGVLLRAAGRPRARSDWP
jgi:hypothetical protein